jgi:hypothetical protein
MLLNPSSNEPLEVRTSRVPSPEPYDINAQWGERYTIGVDLGQSQDPTAICIVRKLEENGAKPVFQVGHLSRLPLGTTYPAVVSHVIDLLCRPQFRGKAELVIDFTGVGRPVFDMFKVQGVSAIIGVSITGGSAITNDGLIWSVPKGHLISRVQALLHDRRLKIHSDLPDATALVNELQSFRADFTDTGYIKFNARSGAHDDLVLALAIALWRAHGDDSHAKWMDFFKLVSRGGWDSKPAAPQPRAKFKRPPGSDVTNVNTITGRSLLVDPDGTIELPDGDDTIALLSSGWTRVESF